MRTKLNLFLISATITYALSAGAQGAVPGSIVAWGENTYGECDVPAPNEGFVAISAGYWHSLGLKVDGSIAAWGNNQWGQCNVPSPNTGFVAVASGWRHSLALKADGSVVAWGDNYDDWGYAGQSTVPTPNEGFVAIAAGLHHNLALKVDGSIIAWGRNREGQLNVPQPNTGFESIAGAEYHSLGVKADGSIVAWGYNAFGQCNVPPPNTGFVQTDGGWRHSLGLQADGSISAWGSNGDWYTDVHGNWVFEGLRDVPAPNTNFVRLVSGSYHSLAMKADGRIVAWGRNDWGQSDIPNPNALFAAISGGGTHSLGITIGELHAPVVSTSPAAEVTTSSATLSGILTDDGGEACQYRFRYRKEGGDYLYTSWVGSVTSGQSFGEAISGLSPNTTYYFNAQAKNSMGASAWGNEQSFVAPPTEPVQWAQNGHWYEVVPAPEGILWNAAQAAAEAKGGYLATITSADENTFVFDLTVSAGVWFSSAEWMVGPWIGAYQDRTASDYSEPSGGWRWITGEPWAYTNWLQQQPDNWLNAEDYALYWGYGSITPTWNDGGIASSYVIEYDPAPPTDTTPPVTTISLSGIAGNNPWYRSDVAVTLTATDDDSGIDSTIYSFDSITWSDYIGPFTITAEGETTIYYGSMDNVGNIEDPKVGTVCIDGTAPEISIASPALSQPYEIGMVLVFSASDWVSGLADLSGTLEEADGSGQTVHSGDVPGVGVYTLVINAADVAGNTAQSVSVLFVVYDPAGGFVTGGGWIDSHVNDAYQYMSVGGKANFGFISKYKIGASEPTGQTEFMFRAGNLNFHSSSYEWLVVTGSNYARFKGTGTINGSGAYKFMLWAGDGAPDTFRIKIWWEDGETENVVYDNGFEQAIGGGSIVIHTE